MKKAEVIVIPKPTPDVVKKYLNEWEGLSKYVAQESALDKLFLEVYPKNDNMDEILIKASSLNDFYSTNIFSVYKVAKHIYDLKIDQRLGDLDLVNDIAKLQINEVDKNFYSFSTKYCSHHKEDVYPIYDSYVEKVLMNFKRNYKFATFTSKELKDYKRFVEVLEEFKVAFGLYNFSLKEIDKYLWQLGRTYFPKKYKKKKNDSET